MKLALGVLGLAAVAGVVASRSVGSRDRFDWSGPPGSGKPFLGPTPGGGLLLTWFEPGPGNRFVLRIARRAGGRWSEPRTVIESDRLFVNWADFPSAVETSDGRWVAHWLEKTAEKAYAYHVRVSHSRDRGRTWSSPVTVHSDLSPTEHGFVAMAPDRAGNVAVAWLDGRAMVDSTGSMSLRAATLRPDGSIVGESAVDERTCECCQVSMARASTGLIAAYRDRSAGEVRDIAVARESNGGWLPPTIVARDDWVWKACPVNGPAIAAMGGRVAVAWFTAAGGKPAVKAAFSSDGGARFGPPAPIDEGNPLGRVHLDLVDERTAVVVWLETRGDAGSWRARLVTEGGRTGKPITIGETSRTREAGFPRLAVRGSDLFVAWTAPLPRTRSADGQVRVSRIPLASLR